jgi:hypothetical protein
MQVAINAERGYADDCTENNPALMDEVAHLSI